MDEQIGVGAGAVVAHGTIEARSIVVGRHGFPGHGNQVKLFRLVMD
jgi:hypothetical protein